MHRLFRSMQGVINLETLMPMSLAISACGGAFWISSVATRLDQAIANLEYLREQRQKFDIMLGERLNQNQRDISDIKAMQAAMDAKLGMLLKK